MPYNRPLAETRWGKLGVILLITGLDWDLFPCLWLTETAVYKPYAPFSYRWIYRCHLITLVGGSKGEILCLLRKLKDFTCCRAVLDRLTKVQPVIHCDFNQTVQGLIDQDRSQNQTEESAAFSGDFLLAS